MGKSYLYLFLSAKLGANLPFLCVQKNKITIGVRHSQFTLFFPTIIVGKDNNTGGLQLVIGKYW
jgi:hypothetical protein